MSSGTPTIDEIYWEVSQIESPEERVSYLDRVCGDSPEDRKKIEKLLKAQPKAEKFLEQPAFLPNTIAISEVTEKPGDKVGNYKLLEQIGEGGMGVIYMAQQNEPVKRKVALKLIKAGLDTNQVVARFEAERQALALMDHTNIAKIHDGGVTESGRPYFVMELVRGIPITEYCDKEKLTTTERLKLFITVCKAIQHAHQKGVIHRDIKPSNILVTLNDDVAVPKIIDFGIAKAINQELTEQTLFTNFEAMIGTPLYISPEQAEMTSLDIDTRSDVYSLGVLLYELLTGSTPFEREKLKQASHDEIRRIIREDEPPNPSARISTLGAMITTVSENRSTDPRKLSQTVRGDLDWIVMKALEKNRNRRYETASAFSADVNRFLNDEPIEARPPSTIYRLRKFSRRHRTQLTTSLVILVTIFTAVGFFTVDRAAQQKDRETRRLDLTQQINDSLTEAERLREQARGANVGDLTSWTEARQVAVRAETLSENKLIRAELRDRVKLLLAQLKVEERDRRVVAIFKGAPMSGAAVNIARNIFRNHLSLSEYERAFREYGIDPQKMTVEKSAAIIRSRPFDIRRSLMNGLEIWATMLSASIDKRENTEKEQKTVEWLRALAEAVDNNLWRKQMHEALSRKEYKKVAELANSVEVSPQSSLRLKTIAYILLRIRSAKKLPSTLALLLDAQKQFPGDFWINNVLRDIYQNIDPPQHDEAVRYASAALAVRSDNAGALLNLGNALSLNGRPEEAISIIRRAIKLKPQYASLYNSLGNQFLKQGKFDAAIVEYRNAVQVQPNYAYAYNGLGVAHLKKGDWDGAIAGYRMAIKYKKDYAFAYGNLGTALRKKGEYEAAIDSFRTAFTLNPRYAKALGSLAWLLATCTDERYRDPEKAVEFAKRAIEITPQNGNSWNTLGVAHYRAGDLQSSIEALEKSMELSSGGDANDWFFLAMIEWKLGNQEKAQEWYEKSVMWMQTQKSNIEDLKRFQIEAAELLGIPIPATKQKKQTPLVAPRPRSGKNKTKSTKHK